MRGKGEPAGAGACDFAVRMFVRQCELLIWIDAELGGVLVRSDYSSNVFSVVQVNFIKE